MFVRMLGMVPGAIIFGAIFDSTCVLWQEQCGDSNGSCWIYDNFKLSLGIFIATLCLKCASLTFVSLAYILYKPPAEEMKETEEGNDRTESSQPQIGYDNPHMEMGEQE